MYDFTPESVDASMVASNLADGASSSQVLGASLAAGSGMGWGSWLLGALGLGALAAAAGGGSSDRFPSCSG